jgi:Signal peptidase subunit
VVAVYDTPDGRHNAVVLWDKIVQNADADDAKVLDERNLFVKYALVDKRGGELRGLPVSLQLQWDHMPITGWLHTEMQPLARTSNFTLPTEYQ